MVGLLLGTSEDEIDGFDEGVWLGIIIGNIDGACDGSCDLFVIGYVDDGDNDVLITGTDDGLR